MVAHRCAMGLDCTPVCNARRCTPHHESRSNSTMTASSPAPADIRPFRVAIPDAELDDLKERLARTRWPDRETVRDWSQGVRVENARSLVSYWEREYDWRRFESGLNAFPQFLTTIDGLDIHFVHVRSTNPDALPLILTHGWPGSIADFLSVDRAAHGSGRVRRGRRRFLRRRHPVAPGIRVLRQADRRRMGRHPHRRRVGGAHAPTRLPLLGGPRRRLGGSRHHGPRRDAT